MFNVILATSRVKYVKSLEHAELIARRENGFVVPLTQEAAEQIRKSIVEKAIKIFHGKEV